MNKLYSNIFWLLVKAFMNYGLRFVYLIFVVKLLLPSEYGIVSTINSWVFGIFAFGAFGLSMAFSRLTGVYEKLGKEQLKNLVGFALKYSACVVFIILTVLVINYHFNFIPKVRVITPFIAVGVALYFPYAFLSNIIYGLQRMTLLTVLDVLTNVLKIVFAVGLIYIGFNYLGVVYGLYLAYLVVLVMKLFILRKTIGFGKIDLKNIFSHSISGYITDVFYAIAVQGRIIIASFLFIPHDVGIMSFALGVSSYIGVLPGIVNNAMFPLIARDDNTKNVFKKGLLAVVPISILAIILVSSFFKPIFTLLGREEYLVAGQFITLFLIAEFVNSISLLFLNQIYAMGHHKFTRKVYILMLPVVLIANYLLMKQFGIFGAGISYLFYNLLLVGVSGYFLYRKRLI